MSPDLGQLGSCRQRGQISAESAERGENQQVRVGSVCVVFKEGQSLSVWFPDAPAPSSLCGRIVNANGKCPSVRCATQRSTPDHTVRNRQHVAELLTKSALS